VGGAEPSGERLRPCVAEGWAVEPGEGVAVPAAPAPPHVAVPAAAGEGEDAREGVASAETVLSAPLAEGSGVEEGVGEPSAVELAVGECRGEEVGVGVEAGAVEDAMAEGVAGKAVPVGGRGVPVPSSGPAAVRVAAAGAARLCEAKREGVATAAEPVGVAERWEEGELVPPPRPPTESNAAVELGRGVAVGVGAEGVAVKAEGEGEEAAVGMGEEVPTVKLLPTVRLLLPPIQPCE
jgi:hypothetical protein